MEGAVALEKRMTTRGSCRPSRYYRGCRRALRPADALLYTGRKLQTLAVACSIARMTL